jgi:hypothetical protein
VLSGAKESLNKFPKALPISIMGLIFFLKGSEILCGMIV